MGQGISCPVGRRRLHWHQMCMVPRKRPRRGGRGGGGGGGGRGRGRDRERGRAAVPEAIFPHLLKLFAPLQRTENDIPVIVFDVYDDEPRYRAVMKAIKKRHCDFAPDVVGDNVPILPFSNPATGPIHFIISLTNRMDPFFMVDLLICDKNLYFIAFRRHRFLSENERAAAEAQAELGEEKVQIKEGPGIWYRCSDVSLPACLNTEGENMGLNCSHRADMTTPGGAIVLNEIFAVLSRFEDRTDVGVNALNKAVQRIIVTFCEAARFRSVCNEIARRIQHGEEGSELSNELWKLIRSWDVLTGKVLESRRRGELALDTPLPEGMDAYGFDPEIHTTMTSLVGPEGELMVLLNDETLLIEKVELDKRAAEDGSEDVAEPYFPGHVHRGPVHGA